MTYGDTEFEQFHNDELVGEQSEFGSILDQLTGRDQEGNDVVTNLDLNAQRIAAEDLEAPASAPWSRSNQAAAGSW